ncbi:Plasmodium vivax Vir protein, putative [Plasmodium vivax]|uniref:Vir protein, putative n=1 Tax=Plasmodium vivax TaxID=5855 RepID=A0A1G4ED93_PLAVI|nr:Plasmodium vivax Vir protein, putative [Plasmodium vivax]
MQDIVEDVQIPNIYYSILDKPHVRSILNNLISFSAVKIWIKYEETWEILAKLARNIELINSDYPDNREKRCRDVNHWINEEMSKYESKETNEKISSYVLAIFNDIKWKKRNIERVCERKEKPYPTDHANLMKELDDYCEIRNNVKCDEFENYEEFLKYNTYIKQKRQYFRSKMEEIRSEKTHFKWDKHTIGCKCTLNDLDLTFREINCDGLFKEEELKRLALNTKGRSPLEVGFFIIFTPVGSIMSRFKRRKYDLKRNIERVDDDRYSLYYSDRMPEDSENKRYYIEYARQHN